MFRRDWIRWSAALGVILLTGFLCATPSTSSAYSLTAVGPQIGATNPEGVDGTMMFGADFDMEQAGSRIHLQPNFLYWNEQGLSDLNPNFDAFYHFSPAGRVSPYVGGGVGLHFYSSDGPGDPGTDPGANLFAGILIPTSSVTFFAQGRAVITDRDQMGILTGALFSLGR